ncbi:hypothetical protein F4779DRAFT_296327, partial [Xylariaceae sp. FL0662B]
MESEQAVLESNNTLGSDMTSSGEDLTFLFDWVQQGDKMLDRSPVVSGKESNSEVDNRPHPPMHNPREPFQVPSERAVSRRASVLSQGTSLYSSSTASLEDRMCHVLDAAEDMGFRSFDDAITTYYTATFSASSLPKYAQSTSRSRRLRQFLTDLHESSKTWVGREAQGYHEERTEATERVYREELERLAEFRPRNGDTGYADWKKRMFIADMISQLLRDETSCSLWRRDKRYFQEQV